MEGWQPLPHRQDQHCRRREGGTPWQWHFPLWAWSALLHPLKYQGVYKSNAILCFLAGHLLPQALLYWVKPGSESLGRSCLVYFSIFLQKTDENELTAKKMNTKALKTVMIVDEQSWERGKGVREGAGPGGHLPACCLSASNPALQERVPPRSPEAWPEGEGTRAWGSGAQVPPSEAQGAGKKGDYKSQETTKLNTKVGTAGRGGA